MGNNNVSTTGWRVLAIDPRGPCKECQIIPFFDYILEINGNKLGETADALKKELESNRNKQTKLTILNYKTMKVRKVDVCPCDNWGGVGMIGLMIASDSYATADERVIRVLSVFQKSPAEAAGLHPFVDYILGTDTRIFRGLDAFEEFVIKHIDTEIQLVVYNSNICQVREVRITATSTWSAATDQGVLGCEVGSGLLHKIPEVLAETVITVHEALFSNIYDVAWQVAPRANGKEIPIRSTDIIFSVEEISETTPLVSEQDNVSRCKRSIDASIVEVSEPNPQLSSSQAVQNVTDIKGPTEAQAPADVSTSAPIEPAGEEISKTGSSFHGALSAPEETKITDTKL